MAKCTCRYEKRLIDYKRFDDLSKSDLKVPHEAEKILNDNGRFSAVIPKGFLQNDASDLVTISLILKRIKNSTGLYHIWEPNPRICEIHETHELLCSYVGKGIGDIRIKKHLKDKFGEKDLCLLTFYPCENRIAKYLEQAFLDSYHFGLNTAENPGRGPLYSYWSEDRYDIGTETGRIAEAAAVAMTAQAAKEVDLAIAKIEAAEKVKAKLAKKRDA